MSFTEAISSGFRKYVVFNGRSSRSELWWWVLFTIVGYVLFAVVDGIIGTFPLLLILWALAVLLPGLAVEIRRLHDRDKSGWWLLISFIPFVGWIGSIVLIVWFVGRGTEGPNRFGEDPLQA